MATGKSRIINECMGICFFPASSATNGIEYILKKKYSIPNSIYQKVIKLPSRYVMFRRSYPQCFIYDKGIFLT